MSPSELLNLHTAAPRAWIYYPNAKSLVITNELWEAGGLYMMVWVYLPSWHLVTTEKCYPLNDAAPDMCLLKAW